MAIFGDFFVSCICSEPRAALFRLSDLHSKFALGQHQLSNMVDINLRPLRLAEEKKKMEDRNNMTKIWYALLHRATITNHRAKI